MAKNAINKEMLKGLQNTFETIQQDSSARVVMITSLVPGVFCAGADLKVVLPHSHLVRLECLYSIGEFLCYFLFVFHVRNVEL